MKPCKKCNKDFTPIRSNQMYCTKICLNQAFNEAKKNKLCICGKLINNVSTWCVDCAPKRLSLAVINNWQNGCYQGKALPRTIRIFLLEKANYKCSSCGFNTPHPDDNSSILEIDHIDGDSTNNIEENLRVVCPNCHALSSTYRGRNVGNCTRKLPVRYNKV